ncbi:MAG: tetraacyldisaccharide 4'-kinase [Hyphobacterium sp.]|nr:MAG: tetraacyldisaccharide 4'-kinase [Hyphobacterium sp.]
MKPPQFWYHPPATVIDKMMSQLTIPMAALYEASVARRLKKTKPVRVDAAVICVGNLTMGGTGKTPVTMALLQTLKDMGMNAKALSRGYGGSEKGPVRVDVSNHTASDVGDEPLLLARSSPVWVSTDRVDGARAAIRNSAQAIVMDDGHQNPHLEKDLSLVVIDAEAGWGNGRVFPAGPLRENMKAGLERADAVILMLPDENYDPDLQTMGLDRLEIPILKAWLEPLEAPPAGSLVAFAGIGRPKKFFNALTQAGASLVETKSFSDHHTYSAGDLRALHATADARNAALITTEKDLVRIPVAQRERISVWPVRVQFSEPARIRALLESALDLAAEQR